MPEFILRQKPPGPAPVEELVIEAHMEVGSTELTVYLSTNKHPIAQRLLTLRLGSPPALALPKIFDPHLCKLLGIEVGEASGIEYQ